MDSPLPRAVSVQALTQIEKDFFLGVITEYEIRRLLETVKVQRDILKTIFSYFRKDEFGLRYAADSVRSDTLDELKRRSALEEG